MIKDKGYYLDIFKVDGAMLDRLIATALSSGGSYADLYFEYTTYNVPVLRQSRGYDGAVLGYAQARSCHSLQTRQE